MATNNFDTELEQTGERGKRENKAHVKDFDAIRVGIASPEDIRKWSKGEVKKPETINYRTFKPERDGLFCEKIFGPVKKYECACGRYKKEKFKGVVCERCGVEVADSKVRRERMGHIELAAPVAHIWYLKGSPSPISQILDIGHKNLEKVAYFSAFICIDIDRDRVEEMLPEIRQTIEEIKFSRQREMLELEMDALEALREELTQNADVIDDAFAKERVKLVHDRIRAEHRDADDELKDLDIAIETLARLQRFELIEEDKNRALVKMLRLVREAWSQLSKPKELDVESMVKIDTGAKAVQELLRTVDLERKARELRQEVIVTTSQRRQRAIKRLELIEALIHSKSRPEWMVLDVIPVISPELRPMVQLDGGRFATSDLNDLYRRIINRNNRLNKIIEIHAPDSIVNHEKRLLQEAVDALIDNKRRARPVKGSNQKELKSLSDMLKGKEGRFRKNLLGKRVDYSGRSVIVIGPHLKLHQCGLPKEMALELFKPFVMQQLVEQKMTQNIKTAKRMVDRMHPAVWDGLEKVITEHPVLLNRAPTLHRLSIQAFEPILVDGKAIQVHPLVCHAFNADFDGDQMAVHVPLSTISQSEARVLMLSTQNLFSPADGRPTVSPIQDIVLGSYALTFVDKAAKAALEEKIALHEKDPEKYPAPPVYNSIDEVLFLLESPALGEQLRLNTPVRVRIRRPIFRKDSEIDKRDPITGKEYLRKETIEEQPEELIGLFEPSAMVEYEELPQEFETIIATMTPGQLKLNEVLPYPLKYSDHFLTVELGKKAIADTIVRAQRAVGLAATVKLLDDLKDLGFRWATKYGISIAITDMDPPQRREEILQEADRRSARVAQQFRRGMVTFNEMQAQLIKLWTETYDEIGRELTTGLKQMNPLSIITVSGARGSVKQLAQLSGMRGLMFNQFNEVIHELPVKSSFHKGLSMMEYFVTTHGARKGLADTALRTADAGYLTRRLVDVAQDVMIRADDCGTLEGIEVHRLVVDGETIEQIGDRMTARISLSTLIDPATGQPLIEPGVLVAKETSKRVTEIETEAFERLETAESDEDRKKIQNELMEIGFSFSDHGLPLLKIRSPLTCELVHGICAKCYGVDLSTNKMVEPGVAVGIIAAQSIGEPGTQLTMRTFHTGGVAGSAVIAKTNQYKTAKFMKQFKTDFEQSIRKEQDEETYDMKDFDPTKLLQSQEGVIKDLFNRDFLTIEDEVKATSGKARTERQLKKDEKLQLKSETESRKLWQRSQKTFFYTWTGESSGIVRVEEIFEARRQPRGKAIICPVSGVVRTVQESQFGRWVIVDGVVRTDIKAAAKEAYIADEQDFAAWDATERGDALRKLVGQKLTAQHAKILLTAGIEEVRVYWPILVPPMGNLPVQKGSHVIKGDPLTNGPLDPHDVLELAGAAAVYDYFVENLQSVYKAQGVDINDKHIEVIIRQMLRKRRIIEPGDTTFLPGQVVDRFAFAKEQNRIRQLISEGRMIKYTDPITNENVEREMREPTSEWLLLGISEASLANDSFLSAASFQKQVKMLTDAAVRGKQDHLVGLKENVIVGRLIPAGTGVKEFQSVEVQLPAGQQGPQPTLASMAAGEEAIVMGGSIPTLTLEAMAGLDEGDLEE